MPARPGHFISGQRLVDDSVSPHGVHRIHVANSEGPIDKEYWKTRVPDTATRVHFWFYKIGNEEHFHIAWKEEQECTDPADM